MPLFKGGNKEVIEKIMHDYPSRYVHYKKGETIAMQGECVPFAVYSVRRQCLCQND